MACDTLLDYPGFNEEFNIYTGARDFWLGVFIIHKGKPIAFYSIKLTEYQIRYTVTERELLSIVETLKGFRTILFGHILRIYNDNKTLHVRILILIEY